MKSKILSVFLLLGLTSCITDPNYYAYVKAHRLAYDARSDTYLKLVEASTTISPEDKEIIKSKEAQENKTITDAEIYLGIKPGK